MNIRELIAELQKYPTEMPVKIIKDHNDPTAPVLDFIDECLLETSTGAYVDSSAPEEEWDNEDGKIVHSGERFLLINPIVL